MKTATDVVNEDGTQSLSSLPGLTALVELAEGGKCSRCWKISIEVGKRWKYPDLCYRCEDYMNDAEQFAKDANDSRLNGPDDITYWVPEPPTTDWHTNPDVFYNTWQKPFENHSVRELAKDQTVPRWIGKDGITILEVWGTEEQMMPWIEILRTYKKPKDSE